MTDDRKSAATEQLIRSIHELLGYSHLMIAGVREMSDDELYLLHELANFQENRKRKEISECEDCGGPVTTKGDRFCGPCASMIHDDDIY